MALASIEPQLLPTGVLHYGSRKVCVFFATDLEQMIFMYKVTQYTMKIYKPDKPSVSRLLKVIISHIYRHIQTHRQMTPKIIPRR